MKVYLAPCNTTLILKYLKIISKCTFVVFRIKDLVEIDQILTKLYQVENMLCRQCVRILLSSFFEQNVWLRELLSMNDWRVSLDQLFYCIVNFSQSLKFYHCLLLQILNHFRWWAFLCCDFLLSCFVWLPCKNLIVLEKID